MTNLGSQIKRLREHQGLTQDAFADLLHVTRQTVSNYETGRSQPDLDMLAEISRILQTDVATLLGTESAPQTPQTEQSVERPETRNRAIRRLIISGAVLASLVLIGIPLKQWGLEQVHAFNATPNIYIKFLFNPTVWALGGWCSMQALAVLCDLQPLQKPWCHYAKWILPVVMVLPQLGFYSGFYTNSSLISIDVWMACWTVIRQPAWYALFGAALWLLGVLSDYKRI